jgi:small subunit ribosomal protein S8
MSDNIADMLTRIRNAQGSKLISVSVAFSNLKLNVLEVLKSEGYILGYHRSDDTKTISIDLKYSRDGKPAITYIHKVSKPGKRIYSSISDLFGYFNNMGIYILSTSRGVLSDAQARRLNVGGEIICKVF